MRVAMLIKLHGDPQDQSNGEEEEDKKDGDRDGDKRDGLTRLNDHVDIVEEVLRRLDGPSLCSAACVCRLWSSLARSDSIWEYLCFGRHPSPPSLRRVISVLGGYRRLYVTGVFPVACGLDHYGRLGLCWNPDQVVQLALSLISVDYYERLFGDTTSATPAGRSTVVLPTPERRRRILLRCIT